MAHHRRRRPSAALVVAVIALVVAATGTAVAAGERVDGDSLIKKGSLSGNRLRDHTLTGLQVKLNALGTVPTAKNADELGGKPPSAYLGGGSGGGGSQIGTNGVVKTAGSPNGTKVTLFTSGPFTVTMTCTDDGTETSSEVDASSSEDQSDLNGTFADANTPTDTDEDIFGTPDGTSSSTPATIALVAPSGASAIVTGIVGAQSFGTACWADLTGVH
ncbi:MAG TPA: hypothetical protein VMB27_10595 [Solirubrobacteraceae bacterium]|nr:hypothetical protein [Solirubrobacteraceae bacterium]